MSDVPVVYLMLRADGVWKIGFSVRPKHRRYHLKRMFRQEIVIHKTWPHEEARHVESIVHRSLSEYRVQGEASREIYRATEEVVCAAIEDAIGQIDRPPPPLPPPEPSYGEKFDCWLRANQNWQHVRGYRFALIEVAICRPMVRAEKNRWVAAGGMSDVPLLEYPIPPWRQAA